MEICVSEKYYEHSNNYRKNVLMNM